VQYEAMQHGNNTASLIKQIYRKYKLLFNVHQCATTTFFVQYEAMQHGNNTASLIKQIYRKYKLLFNIHQCAATTALSSA
jgi:uncharacterized membrane-anchored protein YhcB (DUF1043 family)